MALPRKGKEMSASSDEYRWYHRVALALILAMLFLAFVITTPPTGDPVPCAPPQEGLWPRDCP